jgi:hypothetical protein
MGINSFLNKSISIKLIVVVGGFWMIIAGLLFLYFFGGLREGFQAGLAGLGATLDYSMGDGVKRSWENSNASANNTTPIENATMATNLNQPSIINDTADIYSQLENNVSGPIPLPEDELLFFDTNKFSPECCPSSYSNSEGCLCAAPEQMKYLNERGGNRTLTSEY